MSSVELEEVNDGIKSSSHNSSILSPSIDFLSQDQKILLAERSSRVSRADNVRRDNDEYKKSQDEILKKYLHQHISSTSMEHGRRSLPADDRRYLSSTENEALAEIQDRMTHFQVDNDTEIKNQDEDTGLHEQKRRRKILWASFILIVVLISMILLTVFLVTQNNGVKDGVSPNVGGSDFSVEDCYSRNYLDPMRHNNFRLFLISYYPMLSESIGIQGSSANVALCWLSQYDKLYQNPLPKHGDALAQRFVLVILYFSLTQSDKGMPTDRNVFATRNWLSRQDVCEWTLVGCQQSLAGFRYVTSLDFSDLRINGVSVPSEIALLENLRKLTLNPIAFEGTIPLELNRLTNLEIFEIRVWGPESAFEVDKVIESWIHLEQLSLELSFSNGLPDFAGFTKLKSLEVWEESLQSSYEFPDIRKLTRLEVLQLELNLDGDIPSYLWSFSNLENLRLLTELGTIPSEIGRLSNLKTLTVSGLIPSEIGNLLQLQNVFLRSHYSIPSEIGKLSTLGPDLTIWCADRQYLPKDICSPKSTFKVQDCRCN